MFVSVLIAVLLLIACVSFAFFYPIIFSKFSTVEESGWMPQELERINFPGGNIVVRRIQYNPSMKAYISLSIETRISSGDELLAYVNSRDNALEELLDSKSDDEKVYVTVTFKEALGRMDFVDLWRDRLEKPLDFAVVVKNETSGELGTLVLGMPSHDEPNFMEYFTNPKGFQLVSVIAFRALVRVDVAKTFRQDSRVLLVDPKECPTIRGLVTKYNFSGFDVVAEMPPFLHAYVTDLPDFTP